MWTLLWLACSGGGDGNTDGGGSTTPDTATEQTDTGGTGSTSCFVAGTPVATPAGPRAIETLNVGDLVFSADLDADGQRVVHPVVDTLSREVPGVLQVAWPGGGVEVTHEHPFWDPAHERWVLAGDLRVGSPLWAWRDGAWTTVAVRQVRSMASPRTVYNLTVAGEHNYLADGVLVHNKDCYKRTGDTGPPPSGETVPTGGTGTGDTYVDPWDSNCFVAGTPVDTPSGPRAIETLEVGELVWSVDLADGERRVPSPVVHTMNREVAGVLQVAWPDGGVEVTREHPFWDPTHARWVRAGDLHEGSPLRAWRDGDWTTVRVQAVRSVPSPHTVYNLTVAGEHNYLVDGVLVHNKEAPDSSTGGTGPSAHTGPTGDSHDSDHTCFVAGTPVATPAGPRSIESLKVGELVWSVDLADGERRVASPVLHTMNREVPGVLQVAWPDGGVEVTREHPFWDPTHARWVRAGDLQVGSPLRAWRDGDWTTVRVQQVRSVASPRTVYNLTVAGEHNYLVDGVLVHNKSTFRNTGGEPTGAATGDSGSTGSTGDSSAPSGHTGPGGTGPGGTGPSTTSGSGTPTTPSGSGG